MRSHRRSIAALVTATVAALIVSATPAAAAQHQNANEYVYWNQNGPVTAGQNIDQIVLPKTKGASTYWALTFDWGDTGSWAGYMGLQTNGNRSDGSTGDTAVFALWGAFASSGDVTSKRCAWNGESQGHTCAMAYTFKPGFSYRYRMWKLNADSNGQWWGAWISSSETGIDTWIGSLRVPKEHVVAVVGINFSEYFGTAVSCDAVPKSVVEFTQPAADQIRPGVYARVGAFSGSARGSCTGGTVVLKELGWTKAASVTLGGRR